MAVPIQQRVMLWLSDYRSISEEWLQECFDAGARVILPHLNNVAGEVPYSKVARWKGMGYKVGGAIRPSGDPIGGPLWDPDEHARWASSEVRRLSLNGPMHFNNEIEVQQADLRGERWSERNVKAWRALRPKFASVLNTFPCEGLDHAPYIAADYRGCFQTFGERNLMEWTPTWYRNREGTGWAQRVGWASSKIKICWPVHTLNGQRVDLFQVGREGKESGVIGGTLYPTEAAMPPKDFVVPYIRTLITVGAAK